ncbi:MAG TPA: chorismate synthase [Anaerolineales bacterium]|nr:chorismate synthase [Anaerolineales bacterium]HLB46202.1 chorismate synthase [Anaerolineales bacterium]
MPLRFLTSGESHGPALTAILEGMPAGLALSLDDINPDLARRQGIHASGKPYPGASPRMKLERDTATILSGVMAGITIGAPIAVQVQNLDHAKWKGRAVEPMTIPRPGHADLTGAVKYGYSDLRISLERASARETVARVAVGAMCRKLLAEFGIRVGSYVVEIGGVTANVEGAPLEDRIRRALESEMSCPDDAATAAMRDRVTEIMQAKDTLGGVFEVVALGVPPGLGSHVHWDRRLSGRLAQALMSIHAMKGVEIGDAFANARKTGTQVHDEITIDDDKLARRTNRAGGLEGGITTGEPIVLRVAMKPISTTLNPLMSVDLATGKEAATEYERSDFCAVPRAGVIGEAMACFVLADALLEKLGGDSIAEMKPRFETLRQSRLEDLHMLNEPTVFWP